MYGTSHTRIIFLVAFAAILLSFVGCTSETIKSPTDPIGIDPSTESVSTEINFDTVGSLVEVARFGDATVHDIVYSHDGNLLFLATSLGIQVLDAETLEERGDFGIDTFFSELVLSNDGSLLAATTRNTITVWQLQEDTATELYTISPATPDADEFRAMAFHPDTGELWTVEGGYPDLGSTIIAHRQAMNGEVQETKNLDPPSWINSFAIAPRTGLVAGSLIDEDFNGDVLVWDANTGDEKHLLENHKNFIGSLSFSPDEQFLATASGQLSLFSEQENRVTLWNFADTSKFETYDGHNSFIYSLAIDPKSGNVVSADDEGRILWWDQNQKNPAKSAVDFNVRVTGLAFSPDGSRLAAAAEDGSIQIFTARGEELVASRERNGSGVTDLDIAADAGQFVTSHVDGSLRIWQIGEDQPLVIQDKGRIDYEILTRRESVDSVAISSDSNSIVAFEWVGRNFLLWQRKDEGADSLTTGPVVEEFALQGRVDFSDDSRTFVIMTATSRSASIEFWRKDGQAPIFQTTEEFEEQDTLPPLGLAISADGKLFSYGLPTGDIKVRSVDDGEIRYTLTSGVEAVTAVAFAPEGEQLLSASDLGTLNLWSLKDGSKLATVTDEENHWRGIVFSPDGSLIAAASQQGMVVFYNVTDLNEIARLKAHASGISALAFNRNGELLLSSSLDGTIRAWGVGRE